MRYSFAINAIFQAHNGAEKMPAQGYDYERDPYYPCAGEVINPEGFRYWVSVDQKNWWYCSCPQCTNEGICKHQIYLLERFAEEDECERRAAEYREGMEEVAEVLAQKAIRYHMTAASCLASPVSCEQCFADIPCSLTDAAWLPGCSDDPTDGAYFCSDCRDEWENQDDPNEGVADYERAAIIRGTLPR